MSTPRQQPDARTALATRRENGGVATNTLADQIRAMEKQFQAAMPRGAEATQLVRDALTALRMNPKLGECDATSVLGGLMTCAQLGLRPGVLGHAWLLPFWDSRSRGSKAQLVIGYQGLIELAMRSNRIQSLIARTVYANDEFEVDYGLADSLVHKPNLFEDRGEPIAYYAIAKFTTGGHAFIVMTHQEMLAYRKKNAKARNKEGDVVGPWVDNFEGMAHKTCIRQLSKYMPKSTELAVALAADDGVRVDLTPHADAAETTDPVWEGEVVDDNTANAGGPDGNTAARKLSQAELDDLGAVFLLVDMADKGDRLGYINEVLAEHDAAPVQNPNDLTAQQAGWVRAKLADWAKQLDPDGSTA